MLGVSRLNSSQKICIWYSPHLWRDPNEVTVLEREVAQLCMLSDEFVALS